jgi:hypothetical protein
MFKRTAAALTAALVMAIGQRGTGTALAGPGRRRPGRPSSPPG